MALHQVIKHLSSSALRLLVESMQQGIGSDVSPGPCVYFAAPYENLHRILKSGVILPRNSLSSGAIGQELSATSVQNRRGEVLLGDGRSVYPPRQTHDCVNLFFNPANTTIDAMCRNQLSRFGAPLAIGILELPLDLIDLHHQKTGGIWACSNRNIASRARTTSDRQELQAEKWPWKEIFSLSDETRKNQSRSAEFLLWLEGGENGASAGLPISLVSRILQTPGNSLGDAIDIARSEFTGFRTTRNLFEAEHYLASFSQNSPYPFDEAISSFPSAVEAMPFDLSAEYFLNGSLAWSRFHGIPHVTRVMFWVHYLTHPLAHKFFNDGSRDDAHLAHDAIFATLIHDLRRKTDMEDHQHGEDSARHFEQLIVTQCAGDELRIRRVVEAVTWHCRPDSEYSDPTNMVYQILKDADALDRGRLGGPCHASDYSGTSCQDSRCEHNGCAYKTLRLSYSKVYSRSEIWPFSKNLAYAAWNIARSTYTAPWPQHRTGAFLAKWLRNSIDLILTPTSDDSPFYAFGEGLPKKVPLKSQQTGCQHPVQLAPDLNLSFRLSSGQYATRGTWIYDASHGIGCILQINATLGRSDSHRVWFARADAVMTQHPLRGRDVEFVPEETVPSEIRKGRPLE